MNSDLRKNQLVTDRLFAKLRIEFEWNYTLHGKNIVIENLQSDKFHGEKAIEIYLPIMNKYQLQFGDYTKIFTLNYGEIKIINIGPKDMESNNKTEEI